MKYVWVLFFFLCAQSPCSASPGSETNSDYLKHFRKKIEKHFATLNENPIFQKVDDCTLLIHKDDFPSFKLDLTDSFQITLDEPATLVLNGRNRLVEDGKKAAFQDFEIVVSDAESAKRYQASLKGLHNLCQRKFDFLNMLILLFHKSLLETPIGPTDFASYLQSQVFASLSPLSHREQSYFVEIFSQLDQHTLKVLLKIFDKEFNPYQLLEKEEVIDPDALVKHAIKILNLLIRRPDLIYEFELRQLADFLKVVAPYSIYFDNQDLHLQISNLFLRPEHPVESFLLRWHQDFERRLWTESDLSNREIFFSQLRNENDLLFLLATRQQYRKDQLDSRPTQNVSPRQILEETRQRVLKITSLYIQKHPSLPQILKKLLRAPELTSEEIKEYELKGPNDDAVRLHYDFEFYGRYGTVGGELKEFLKSQH